MEAAQIASGKSVGELAREAELNEHNRSEKFKEHFEKLAILILWGLAIGLGVIGVIWLFHLISPRSWHWLSEEQLGDLQAILTGGLIVGVLTDHFRKRLK